jgi:hypothetical protein
MGGGVLASVSGFEIRRAHQCSCPLQARIASQCIAQHKVAEHSRAELRG